MTDALQNLSTAVTRLVTGLAPSVVAVHSRGARSSGFVWKPGLIVTSDERLADEGDVAVRLIGGLTAPATIVGRDASTAIALLRIDDTTGAPAHLSTEIPDTGTLAVSVGVHDDATMTALGVIARKGGPWQSMRGGEIDARLDLDMRLGQFSEGGLVVAASGAVFGMVVLGPRRRVLAIPSATISRIAAQLEQRGKVLRGYLGLGLHPVTVEHDGGIGAIVMNVDAKGPAAAAGIHQGDVLVSWNGTAIDRLRMLLRGLGADTIGQTLALGIRRGGQVREIELTIGEKPMA